jgi:hypothetical protein
MTALAELSELRLYDALPVNCFNFPQGGARAHLPAGE